MLLFICDEKSMINEFVVRHATATCNQSKRPLWTRHPEADVAVMLTCPVF